MPIPEQRTAFHRLPVVTEPHKLKEIAIKTRFEHHIFNRLPQAATELHKEEELVAKTLQRTLISF